MQKNTPLELPTLNEFKSKAKELKNCGKFNKLGHAQDGLAKEFGYKDFNSIRPYLKEKKTLTKNEKSLSEVLAKNMDKNGKVNISYSQLINQIKVRHKLNKNDKLFIQMLIGNNPIIQNETSTYLIENDNHIDGFGKLSILFARLKNPISKFHPSIVDEFIIKDSGIYFKSKYELTYPYGKTKSELEKICDNEELINLVCDISKVK